MKVKSFSMLDIESLGTPGDCGSTKIAMPSFAFVVFNGFDTDPELTFVKLNVQEQLNRGATISASTLAFWMGQAQESLAANHIKEALNANSAEITTFNNGYFSGQYKTTNLEMFKDIKRHFDIIDPEGKMLHYGNGPEFDMTIYSAVSCLTNKGSEIIPWKFWNLGNVRTLRNLYQQAGYHYKTLEEKGVSYAKAKMEKMKTIKYGIYPVKHDPAFDALVESYCVAKMIELIKI